jgi:hypothetical protein
MPILEVHLTDAVFAPGAVAALAPMGIQPPQADGAVVRVLLRERAGAVVEAVRRLDAAWVAVDDLAVAAARPALAAA